MYQLVVNKPSEYFPSVLKVDKLNFDATDESILIAIVWIRNRCINSTP